MGAYNGGLFDLVVLVCDRLIVEIGFMLRPLSLLSSRHDETLQISWVAIAFSSAICCPGNAGVSRNMQCTIEAHG